MRRLRPLAIPLLIALLLAECGCLFRTRKVEMRMSTAKLMTADRQQLLDMVNSEATKVKTVNATVEIATEVGGEKKGKVTDYQQISGYILLRKPNALRMIGLFPLVRNKAFDMVSDGDEFKLSIPLKSKFYVGHNDVVRPVLNPLENLRPSVIYNALLVPEINGTDQIAVLEDSTETVVDPKSKQLVEQPDYVLDVLSQTNGTWYLARKIIFDRSTLTPHRQLIYNKDGNIATEATYQVFHDYNGISFPNVIQIERPQEEYSITLTVTKLTLNEPLRDDQFVLQQPPGSILVNLDQAQTAKALPQP